MNQAEILAEFEAAEAILRGHFILSSGLHSDTYLQCARVLMNPARAERLCRALAEKLSLALGEPNRSSAVPPLGTGEREATQVTSGEAYDRAKHTLPIDMVIAPAMGGVIVGYEMGRQLGVETIFCEREAGEFTLRRGFTIRPGARVLLVEDVVTTGKSSLETVTCIEQFGGTVVAEASLIDRSGGKHGLPFPLISLLALDVKTYPADQLPEHLRHSKAVKPGSRWLQKNTAS